MKKLVRSSLKGEITIPSSKSHLHRILFASLLKESFLLIKVNYDCLKIDDIQATLNVLSSVGVTIKYSSGFLEIDSSNISYDNEVIDCLASGTTLRMAIVILLYLFKEVRLTGTKKLMSRPLDFYEELFLSNKILFEIVDNVCCVRGDIGNIFKDKYIEVFDCKSSQFISSLMFVTPFYNKDFEIVFKHKMESVSYLEVTKQVLNKFNIDYDFEMDGGLLKKISFKGKKDNIYEFTDAFISVELDYSSFSFWFVANHISNDSDIMFLNDNILDVSFFRHPDQVIINIVEDDQQIIDLAECPDLLPILFIWGLFREREWTKIINYERNRFKESNRVEDMIFELNKLGANIEVFDDYILVNKVDMLEGGLVNCIDDHRIAMAFAICSLRIRDFIGIENPDSVKKSYYNFWKDFEKLGGKYESVFR